MPVTLPPLDGSLQLPQLIDFHLHHNPSSTVYVFCYDDANRITISFAEFIRAIHRAAPMIRAICGGPDRKVVAIIATADTLLYQTVTLAIIMCGLVPFLISPRNSPAAIDDMLKKMDCTDVMIVDSNSSDIATTKSLTIPHLRVHGMPTLAQLYGPEKEGISPQIQRYSVPTVKPTDTAFIIHSSGSTGFPKPVPQSFATVLHWMNFLDVSGIREPSINVCAAMAIPSFHAFGVNFQLLYPLTLVKPATIFPPMSYDFRTGETFPRATPLFPQPANVLQHIEWTGADMLLSVPSLLTSWRVNPSHVKVLKGMRCVCCSSGPLPQDVGDDLVRQGVPLCTSYGATEFGIPTYRLPLSEDGCSTSIEVFKNIGQRLKDWRYVAFNKHVTLRLIPQTGSSDVFELQILTSPSHQPAIENLPDVPGYATHDVVQAHPTRKGLWRVIGRTDEVIVLSAGEKVVPNPIEDKVNSSPDIAGALMFGRGRPHCGLIIEPRDHERWFGKGAHLIDTIWPYIEEANSRAPAFSRILREMVVVATRARPMERVGKGSLARQATLATFDTQIDEAYRNFGTSTSTEPPVSWERVDLLAWLQDQVNLLLPKPQLHLDANEDLFRIGFDSISTVALQSRIFGALPLDRASISASIGPTFVYENPTLNTIADALLNILAGGGKVSANGTSKMDRVTMMIAKYSHFDSPTGAQVRHSNAGYTVLLTGTTGSVGSYVIDLLLRRKEVTRIFAVNRHHSDTPASVRQTQAFRSKGLEDTIPILSSPKLVWIDGDPVDQSNLLQWKDQVDIVIHNAWKVNFNQSLASFEPLVQSTHALVEVLRSSPRYVRFFFVSSTSAAQNWDATQGPVPEKAVESKHALGKGYGESKHVVEKMLEGSGIDATVLRIGQACGGAPLGAWNTSDWVPAIVKSSIAMGALPSAVGTVSWIDLQSLAKSIVDVVFSPTVLTVVNLLHPKPTDWDHIALLISEQLFVQGVTNTRIPTIPFSEWFKKLELASTIEDPADVPAINIVEFFRHFAMKDGEARTRINNDWQKDKVEAGGRARFELRNALETSASFRNLESRSVGEPEKEVKMWIGYWRSSTFI